MRCYARFTPQSLLGFAAIILLIAQVSFQRASHHYLPNLGIVPPAPSHQEMQLSAFGDTQFLFRIYALMLQQSGDTFGRTTALYKYDYPELKRWFFQMDTLDERSAFFPALASYYFSQSQNASDVIYIVDYLDAHTAKNPRETWWWVVQAAYLAKHKLKNTKRAVAIASRLALLTDIPLWAQQYPAFLHEQMGEFDDALTIMQNILATRDDLSKEDLGFMAYFARDRLHKMEEAAKIAERLKTQEK